MFALFYENGIVGTWYSLRAGSEGQIRHQLSTINDWFCLVRMGKTMGPKSDQPSLRKLENFLSCKTDRSGIENFGITLSTGSCGCVMCAETQEEVERMRGYVIKKLKRNKDSQKDMNMLFSEILASFDDDVLYNRLVEKLSQRQFIGSGNS